MKALLATVVRLLGTRRRPPAVGASVPARTRVEELDRAIDKAREVLATLSDGYPEDSTIVRSQRSYLATLLVERSAASAV